MGPDLIHEGRLGIAFAYAAATVAFGVAAVFAGSRAAELV